MPDLGAGIVAFFESDAGQAIGTAVASTAVGAGASALLNKKPKINIPPPPGAAMIDSAGANAAAATRRRQAVAGGIGSTLTGAGVGAPAEAAFGGATSGSKALSGQ